MEKSEKSPPIEIETPLVEPKPSQKRPRYTALAIASAIVLASILIVLLTPGPKSSSSSQSRTPTTSEEVAPANLIKNIGFKLDYYNPATKMAGDLAFINIPALKDPAVGNKIWMDYGAEDKREGGAGKRNPQPSFILPAGTKITSMVDGEVTSVSKLYSGDFAIHVASRKQSSWQFEHEHIVNPRVKEGDKVKAGDVIAEVGAHQNWEYGGNGIFEIGILRPTQSGKGGRAECPFKYLDPSVKQGLLAKITAFYSAWESFRKDSTIYDQEHYFQPGCEVGDPMVW